MGIPISALIQKISGDDAQQVKLQGSWIHPSGGNTFSAVDKALFKIGKRAEVE